MTEQRASELKQIDTDAGLIFLNDVGSTYRDGAEEPLLDLLAAATDISSGSADLLPRATNWPERYHLDPMRPNIVRAFDLPATARVLEVGAGCGAITRYLGEIVAAVDSVEPVVERARVAAVRTADLPGVRVFAGSLEQMSPEPVYDAVVIIGVLEYVGGGTADRAPYVEFLRECVSRLAPGGSLVLAIENKLGVKYLAGEPEDHYGRPYVGVEDYRDASEVARTFSLAELEHLLAEVGLSATPLVAFPDYKMTRVVAAPRRLRQNPAESLLQSVPSFPSPRWAGEAAPGPEEQALWRSYVQAELGAEAGNSLVLVARRPTESGPELWPDERALRYFSWERHPDVSVTTDVVADGARTRVVKTAPVSEGPVRALSSAQDFVDGTPFLDALFEGDGQAARALVDAWHAAVQAASAEVPTPLDLVPSQLRVSKDGSVSLVGAELVADDVTGSQVLERGMLEIAARAALAERPTWADRDVVSTVGGWLGVEVTRGWLEQAIDREAALTGRIAHRTGQTPDEIAASERDELRRRLGLALPAPEPGPEPVREAPSGEAREAARLRKRLAGAQREIKALRTSTSWRVTAPLRSVSRLWRDRF